MKVNGSTEFVTAKASKSGSTAAATRDNGVLARLTELENCTMQTAIYMKESGLMTRLMETAPTLMLTELSMWALGATISSTASVLRLGPTEQSTRGSTTMERKTVEES